MRDPQSACGGGATPQWRLCVDRYAYIEAEEDVVFNGKVHCSENFVFGNRYATTIRICVIRKRERVGSSATFAI